MIRRRLLALPLTLCLFAAISCGEDSTPTQPGTPGDHVAAAVVASAAGNTWTAKAPPPFTELFLFSAGVAPNALGQSILYTFGGTSSEGGCGDVIYAYNATTNTWARKLSKVDAFNTNGVGRIGTRLYVSGGDSFCGGSAETTRATWAYDYANDQLIRVADLPKATNEGVTGVIDGKLYMLPGFCSGEFYPFPGYCAQSAIRLLYRYDPVKNKWGARRACPHFHRAAAGGAINGKFYVAGGTATDALDAYDPATDTWRTLAPIPTGGRAVGTVVDLKLYVIANGHTYVYDPATNIWKTKAPYPASDGPSAAGRVLVDGHARLLTVAPTHTELYTQ